MLLVLPITLLAQNTYLFSGIVEPEPYVVGQIVTVKFTIQYDQTQTNLVQFDYEYNNKLLEKVDHAFKVTGYQTSLNHWDGYKFNPNSNIDKTFLKSQYDWFAGNNGAYSGNPDWSVERITIQGTTMIPTRTDLIYIRFKIKDRGITPYTSYSNLVSTSWAYYKNTATSTTYNVFGNAPLTLNGVTGSNAGTVVLNLKTATTHPTHYKYTIQHTGTQQTVASGYFDSNSQAIVTGLKIGNIYHTDIAVDNQLAKDWLDEVVTVSDAYITFKQAIGAGSSPGDIGANTFSYPLQYLYAEVNNSGNITFDDSYIMLNHIIGTPSSTWYTSAVNGARNFWGRVENYGTSSNEYYFGQNYYFTPTDTEKQFTYSHGLIGDADFSHSALPVASTTTNGRQMAKTAKVAANAENSNLEVSTSLVGGKVVLETKLDLANLVGVEFIVQYDPSVLTFEEVKFDTGNQMTNFATPKDNKIYFGSLDSSGAQTVKTGTPYKLIFTPKKTLTNTSGLVYFKIAEAVKQDGTKVILKIQ